MTNEIGDNARELFAALAKVNKAKKQLEEKEKELRKELAPYLDAIAGKPTDVAGYRFTYAVQPGRKTLDKAALEEAGIDLEPFYKVGKPYSMLKITQVGEGE